jgi:hypothetical protein
MAIISCPECGKKISSKAAMCPNCGFTTGEVTEHELDVFRARRQRDKLYHLNMTSYAVITVFVAGFGWYWWDSGGFQHMSSAGPFILMGLAAVSYLVVRALLFRNRRKLKALKKKISY